MCVCTGGLSPMQMGNAKIIIKYFSIHCKKKGLCQKSKSFLFFKSFVITIQELPELPNASTQKAIKNREKPPFHVFFTTFLFGFF